MRLKPNTCNSEGSPSFYTWLPSLMPFLELHTRLHSSAWPPVPNGHAKDLCNPFNYSGISLLSTISKVFERVLINIIVPWIHCRVASELDSVVCILPTSYRRPFSTLESTKRKCMLPFWLPRKHSVCTVWHQSLFVKLYNKGIPLDVQQEPSTV